MSVACFIWDFNLRYLKFNWNKIGYKRFAYPSQKKLCTWINGFCMHLFTKVIKLLLARFQIKIGTSNLPPYFWLRHWIDMWRYVLNSDLQSQTTIDMCQYLFNSTWISFDRIFIRPSWKPEVCWHGKGLTGSDAKDTTENGDGWNVFDVKQVDSVSHTSGLHLFGLVLLFHNIVFLDIFGFHLFGFDQRFFRGSFCFIFALFSFLNYKFTFNKF